MATKKRIFWLGMHNVLVETELPRLRLLGFEVFNPPYLSNIADQSARRDWDTNQASTLPSDVFTILANYNFFYNDISDNIAEILNEYFDAIIVTISAQWLSAVLRAYRGPIIYRVYGQNGLLSDELKDRGVLPEIVNRDNFWFVPHAAEAIAEEHAWLRERMAVVPYCLPQDVVDHRGSWGLSGFSDEIAITCPNVANSFFHQHFRYLKTQFTDPTFRFYGVQSTEVNDAQIVGTLERMELIQRFKRARGYLYTYTEPRVCYLPPVEMMMLGGPVLFLRGSLLDRMAPAGALGRCDSEEEARRKARILLSGDQSFIQDVVAAQQVVLSRYDPKNVWKSFDKIMSELLCSSNKAPNWLEYPVTRLPQKAGRKRIYILHHFEGECVIFSGGEYAAFDGIPRVVRQMTNALAEDPELEIVVTARADQVANFFGYFSNEKYPCNLRILCLNQKDMEFDRLLQNTHNPAEESKFSLFYRFARIGVLPETIQPVARFIWRPAYRFYKKIGAKVTFDNMKNYLRNRLPVAFRPILRRGWHVARRLHQLKASSVNQNQIAHHIQYINTDTACVSVLVPHYYTFPEASDLSKRTVLYLPDYMPHLFQKGGEFRELSAHEGTGRSMVRQATRVVCNSNFTKEYLPNSVLNVPKEKILVSYLPILNLSRNIDPSPDFPRTIGVNRSYIFYPTQARPNKNIPLLLNVFERLVARGHDLQLVLTGSPAADPRTQAIIGRMQHSDRIKVAGRLTDSQLAWLYQGASVLCFTSLGEGNFPPQIQEALTFDVPVVASRIGFITERLSPEHANALILCAPNNVDEFVAGCELALSDRSTIVARQRAFRTTLDENELLQGFRNSVRDAFGI